MDGTIGTLTAALIGLGGVIIGLPLAFGRAPRNGWYGYRIPRTLASDAVWYPVNALTGRWLTIGGALLLLGALISLLALGDQDAQQVVLWATLAFTGVGQATLIWRGWVLAQELDRSDPTTGSKGRDRAS